MNKISSIGQTRLLFFLFSTTDRFYDENENCENCSCRFYSFYFLFVYVSFVYLQARYFKKEEHMNNYLLFWISTPAPPKKDISITRCFFDPRSPNCKKSSKLYLKTPKWWYRNHSFGDKLTKLGNTAKWSRIYNISKAPPLCEKWNLYRWKFKDLQVLKLSKQI